jgi:hypothetical protein
MNIYRSGDARNSNFKWEKFAGADIKETAGVERGVGAAAASPALLKLSVRLRESIASPLP